MTGRLLFAVLATGSLATGPLACRPVPEVYERPDTDPPAQDDDGGDEDGTDDDPTDDTGEPRPERDWWEGWPQTTFFPTYCSACHPDSTGVGYDFTRYDHVLFERDHIYCGVGLEMVDECYDAEHDDTHEPTSLPQGTGPKPTAAVRQRLIDWMDDGMPRLEDLEGDTGG